MNSRLKALRQARGLTQEQLAARMGCSHSLITRLETGQRGITGKRLEQLCAALRCSPSELLGHPDGTDERSYLISLIAIMPDDKVSALITVAHTMMPYLEYRGPERRRRRAAS